MASLRAAVWNASTDAVLNAFKQAPAFAADLQALEQALRKEQVRDWRHVVRLQTRKDSEALRRHRVSVSITCARAVKWQPPIARMAGTHAIGIADLWMVEGLAGR